MSAAPERAIGGGQWRLLADDGAGAAEGLALDEALMARYARGEADHPPTLRLYTYRSHCALVGRYQNLEAELDLDACQRTGTPVSRRPTGGGAIIMGAGQLGVAVTSRAPAGKRPREIIEELAAAVMAGLAELGITAVFRGKNDLEVDGRKIAGLGLYVDPAGAMLFHASVLADLDIAFMLQVLRIPAAKLADKAAAAVSQRVTTVTEQTGRPWDGAALRPVLAEGFAATFGATLISGIPCAAERTLADALAADRYRARSWLGDRSMSADGSGSAVVKTPVGLARIYLTTHGDLIKSAIVVGDFNELPPALVEMESALRWRRLDERSVGEAVARAAPGTVLPLTPVTSQARISPEYVRISMASAIALRMRSGRFSRDFDFGGINLLLNYDEGCLSDCGYCGLARTRPGSYEDKSFIRVEWPLVRTDDLVDRMAKHESTLTRLCISMVTHGHAYADTCNITRRIAERVRTPLSILVAPPTLNRERLETFKALGVDMIGIGLDAVTEELFRTIRTDVPKGGLKWEKYWAIVTAAREIFGPWKVNVHTLVGLGEADQDLIQIFVALREQQIFSYLFCFNPEPGSRMAGHVKSPLARWRRVQLAKHLIETEGYGLDQFDFDADGGLVHLGADRAAVEAVVDQGVAFMTNGCPGEKGEPGCTRPYGSYRPAEPFRDYPFVPDARDLRDIRAHLALDGLVS